MASGWPGRRCSRWSTRCAPARATRCWPGSARPGPARHGGRGQGLRRRGDNMDLGLNGSRVMITGGSRGIGLAVAEALAAEGAAVGLVARGADGLAAAADRLAGLGAATVATAVGDVTHTLAPGRAGE